MTLRILENCTIFDGQSEDLTEGGSIVIENDRIREIATGNARLNDADTIDMGGRFVMPGLLDIHFHAYSITFKMSLLDTMTNVVGILVLVLIVTQMSVAEVVTRITTENQIDEKAVEELNQELDVERTELRDLEKILVNPIDIYEEKLRQE